MVFKATPKRSHVELGTFDVTTPVAVESIEDLKELLTDGICEVGANAIVPTKNDAGAYVSAVAIKWAR